METEGGGIVEDKLEFTQNKCSKNVRFAESISQKIILDLWHDKHYLDRNQHGDENGPRTGIEADVIKSLVLLALKHLLYYSARIKEFSFLNHDNPNANGDYARIVLQDSYSDETLLNIPIEIHFLDFFKYEVTVISALRVNDFRIGDGQYALELRGEFDSVLRRKVRGQMVEIADCQT